MNTHGIVPESDSRSVRRRRGWRLDEGKLERRRLEIEREGIAEMDSAPEACGLCYFIGCDEGMVKIGWSKDVNQRRGELQGPSIYKLRILAVARGGRMRERYYHRKFADQALGDEWFERTPEIEAEIARLSATPC